MNSLVLFIASALTLSTAMAAEVDLQALIPASELEAQMSTTLDKSQVTTDFSGEMNTAERDGFEHRGPDFRRPPYPSRPTYPSYPSYPSYPTYPHQPPYNPGYPGHPNFPTYPTQPVYPVQPYPSYPTQPVYPVQPGYPSHSCRVVCYAQDDCGKTFDAVGAFGTSPQTVQQWALTECYQSARGCYPTGCRTID